MAVSLSEADLAFVLSVNPNFADVEAALVALGANLNDIADRAMVQIVYSLQRQREELVMINRLMDPTTLKERLRLEQETLKARRELSSLEQKERINQAGGIGNYAWQQVKNLFSGGGQGGQGGPGGMMGMLGALVGGQGGGGRLGQIGGAVGSAFGPGGAEVGAALAKMIPVAIAAPAALVAGSLNMVLKALQGLQGPLGPIGAGLGLVSSAFEGMAGMIKAIPIVGEIFGPFLEALAKIPKIIGEILSTFTALAAKASPGQAKLLQMAIEDVQAVVGAKFLPTMSLMRQVILEIGNVLANILPNGQTIANILRPLANAFKELGDEIIKMGPLIKDSLILALKLVTYEITGMVRALAFVGRGFNAVRKFFGADIGTKEFGAAGAAARPTSFQGFSEYEKEIQKAAFTVPVEQKEDPVATNTKSAAETLSNIYGFMTGTGWTDMIVASIVKSIAGGMAENRGYTKEEVSEAASEAAGYVKRLFIWGNVAHAIFG